MTDLTVADRQAITELLSEYGLRLDQGRFDEWLDLFDEDAQLYVPGFGQLVTKASRRKLIDSAPRGIHLASAPVLRAGTAEGTALAEQAFTFRASGTGDVLTGWYEDVLIRGTDRWYLARRVIHYL